MKRHKSDYTEKQYRHRKAARNPATPSVSYDADGIFIPVFALLNREFSDFYKEKRDNICVA